MPEGPFCPLARWLISFAQISPVARSLAGGGGGGKARALPERCTASDDDSDSEQPGLRGPCSGDLKLAIKMQEAESAGLGCLRQQPAGDAALAQRVAHQEVGPRQCTRSRSHHEGMPHLAPERRNAGLHRGGGEDAPGEVP